MKATIGMTTDNFNNSSEIFSTILTDGMLLYIKTRKFHWNVVGGSLVEYHKLFESHYKMLEEAIDEVAERVNRFSSSKLVDQQNYTILPVLNESKVQQLSSKDMLKELLNDYETLIKSLRKKLLTFTIN